MPTQMKHGRFQLRMNVRTILILGMLGMIVTVLGCGGGGGSGDDGGGMPDDTDATTVYLTGVISTPEGITIDSDVNDPNEIYVSNDTIATAQVVSNPVSIGGYVNVPESGAAGRSTTIGDRDDFFSIEFNAGDKISLAIGDPDAGDLDLYLYDTSGNEIDNSLSVERYETITIADDGIYIVNVYAYSGASNYILAIGADGADTVSDILSTRYDFVPGQAIVRLKDTAQANASVGDRIAAMGMTLTAGTADREMLLTFDDTDIQAHVYQALGVADRLSSGKVATDMAMARKLNTLYAIKALRKRADVHSADPNYIVQPLVNEPDDEYYHLQWHYPFINLPQAWDVTTGSSDVIVAVVDTGALMNHPDLAAQFTDTGYDFISDFSMNGGIDSNDGDGIDADPDDPGDSATAGSSSFHGTHCAGTIAAHTNNGSGVAGVSWGTKIMPIRVLGIGGGTTYDILQGVRYAAGMENDSGIILDSDQTADIISMSLGGSGASAVAQSVFTQVRDAGVILVAAAGNESSSTPFYPASYAGVISVSAVNISGTLASYSNYGSTVDVAAPGGDSGDYDGDGYSDRVWSTCGDDASGSIQFNYAAYNGTSMATPHVAGVVALMKALAPTLTPDELDALLANSTITNDIGDAGKDEYFGYGLIDAYKAVVAVSSGSIDTTLSINPSIINFGTSDTVATLTVDKVGGGAIAVSNFSQAPAAWLTVSEANVDDDGLGTYTVTADRSELSDGNYTAVVTFTASSGSTLSVSVNLQVQSAATSPYAGFHYVLLIDSDTLEVLQQDNVSAVDGYYEYHFSDVTMGERYLIIAGSDRNNDTYIDNPGESLGAYRSLDQIASVVADGDLSGLDFTTDFKLSVSASFFSADSVGDSPLFMRLR